MRAYSFWPNVPQGLRLLGVEPAVRVVWKDLDTPGESIDRFVRKARHVIERHAIEGDYCLIPHGWGTKRLFRWYARTDLDTYQTRRMWYLRLNGIIERLDGASSIVFEEMYLRGGGEDRKTLRKTIQEGIAAVTRIPWGGFGNQRVGPIWQPCLYNAQTASETLDTAWRSGVDPSDIWPWVDIGRYPDAVRLMQDTAIETCLLWSRREPNMRVWERFAESWLT